MRFSSLTELSRSVDALRAEDDGDGVVDGLDGVVDGVGRGSLDGVGRGSLAVDGRGRPP
jgi:hypothetical protein